MGKIASFLGVLFFSILPGFAEEPAMVIDVAEAEHYLDTGAVFIDNRLEQQGQF